MRDIGVRNRAQDIYMMVTFFGTEILFGNQDDRPSLIQEQLAHYEFIYLFFGPCEC